METIEIYEGSRSPNLKMSELKNLKMEFSAKDRKKETGCTYVDPSRFGSIRNDSRFKKLLLIRKAGLVAHKLTNG
jgi:hypothetical protein